jgi:hypothetical protein
MLPLLLAHSEIKTYSPPDGEAYDRYQIKLHKHASALIEEWCDIVLFANFKTIVDAKTGKAVNMDVERVLYSANRPAWRAKSRFALPPEMPMDMSLLLSEIRAAINNNNNNNKQEENNG